MAGSGAMGGAGGTGSGGTSGGAGGAAGTASGGTGGTAGSAGSAGTAGMDPDEDGGVEPDGGDEPGPTLPSDGNELSVCETTADCNGDDLECVQYSTYRGYCAEDCTEETDCAEIEGIAPICEQSACVIDCSDQGSNGDCPANMDCVELTTSLITDPIFRCQYPEPKDKDVYELCNPDNGNADCKGDLICESFPGPLDLRDSVCTATCMEAADCDDLGSAATPVCDAMILSPLESTCALQCAEDSDCPGDMTCIDIDPLNKRCGHEI